MSIELTADRLYRDFATISQRATYALGPLRYNVKGPFGDITYEWQGSTRLVILDVVSGAEKLVHAELDSELSHLGKGRGKFIEVVTAIPRYVHSSMILRERDPVLEIEDYGLGPDRMGHEDYVKALKHADDPKRSLFIWENLTLIK